MCGIAGYIAFSSMDGPSFDRSSVLKAMTSSLARRGPDDEQLFDDGFLALGFRRLSIIDLETGSQPIWTSDHTLCVVVNGEIYNHRELREGLLSDYEFSSESDSEVVLHLYRKFGVAGFKHLNGMFAVALYDKGRQQLVLARDRLGIKPMYMARSERGLIFGSELKALLMHPDAPRRMSLADCYQPIVQRKSHVSTYVEGIEHLQPGTAVTFQAGGEHEVYRFWDFSEHLDASDSAKASDSIQSDYNQLLEDSVNKRLMSDVPVGLFLSGGIDSSLLAALASRHSRDFHCFTVVSGNTIASGDVPQAVSVCESLGLELHAAEFDFNRLGQEFTLREFERSIAMIESPRFDLEWYIKNLLYRFARKQVPDLKVILLGQGADEFAGGYSNMDDHRWQDWDEYLNFEVARDIIDDRFEALQVPDRLRDYMNPDWSRGGDNQGLYHQKMRDLTYQLQHFNLWLEDRASSYEGVEARVPFLDHRLVEFLAGLDASLQQDLFWNKKIVRDALYTSLPDYPRAKDKVPFINTSRDGSLFQLLKTIAMKIYPAFRMLYQDVPGSVFSTEKMDELHHLISASASKDLHIEVDLLLEMMAVTVFNRLIQAPEFLLELVGEQDTVMPPPVSMEQLKARIAAGPDPVNIQFNPDSVIMVSKNGRILTAFKEEQDTVLYFLKGNKIARQIAIPESDFWAVNMVEIVSNAQDGVQFKTLSDKVSVDPERLVQGLYYLIHNGFMELH